MERAIPQRRRRVWVVGCAGGDVTKAAQILFEPKGFAGDNAPRRRTGQEIAAASRGRNRIHGGMVGGAPRDRECVSIEGNGSRPSHRGDGVSEEGCSYTLNAVEQHKVAYKSECFNNVSHPHGKNGEGERWDNGDVASTRNVFDIGETRTQECVVHQPTNLCLDMMGGKIGAHYHDDDTAPTLTHGRGSANDVHAVVSTNSNGEDVMPTLTNDLANQTGNQQAVSGGYIIHELHEC